MHLGFARLFYICVYNLHHEFLRWEIRINGAVVFGGVKRVFHKLRVNIFRVFARAFCSARRGKIIYNISSVKRFCLVKKRLYALVPAWLGLVFIPVLHNKLSGICTAGAQCQRIGRDRDLLYPAGKIQPGIFICKFSPVRHFTAADQIDLSACFIQLRHPIFTKPHVWRFGYVMEKQVVKALFIFFAAVILKLKNDRFARILTQKVIAGVQHVIQIHLLAKLVGRGKYFRNAVHHFQPVAIALHPDIQRSDPKHQLRIDRQILCFAYVRKLHVFGYTVMRAGNGKGQQIPLSVYIRHPVFQFHKIPLFNTALYAQASFFKAVLRQAPFCLLGYYNIFCPFHQSLKKEIRFSIMNIYKLWVVLGRRGSMILLEKKGVITPDMDKTNIAFNFDVPDGVSALNMDFSYSPKTLDDESAAVRLISSALEQYLGTDHGKDPRDFLPVKNLITVSVDDPLGYRGAAHRQPNEQHIVIGGAETSPGFTKGAVSSGTWRVVLNVHCCVCDAAYNLKISGRTVQ